MSSKQFITIGEISDEDGFEFGNQLDSFVEYLRVQDRAITGQLTNLVRIRDPVNGHLIASIRNPKIDIHPYKSHEGVIDMYEAIVNAYVPIFNAEEQPLQFDDRRIGWHVMLDLIKEKQR